jgi:hemerythrin-like metal-binding protein
MREKSIRPLAPLVWLSSFAIDEETLDRQHRKLMADINELTDLLFEGWPWSSVAAKSQELKEDSFEHFKTEEEILKKTAYPQFSQHCALHREIERQLDEIIRQLVLVHRASRGDIEAALYLRSMLIDHFFRRDLAYKSHVMKARGR